MPDRDPQDPRHNDPHSVEPRPVDLGLYSARGAGSRMSATEWVAIALCVVWVSAVAAYIWKAPPGVAPLGLVLTLLVVFLPLALVWVGAVTLRSVHALRHEAAPLQATVEAMRPYIADHLANGGRLHQITRHMLGLFTGRAGARGWRRVLSEQATRPGAGLEVIDAALAPLHAPHGAAD